MKEYTKAIRFILCFGFLTAGLTLFGPTACHTTRLEPGGAYSLTNTVPDMAFFTVDSAYDLAYSAVLSVMKFERDNRAMLWNFSPTIKHTLDAIRPDVVKADLAYAQARTAYLANPTPAGLSLLNEWLSKIQQLLATAQAALPKAKV